MNYYLRQIEQGNSNPLVIELTKKEIVIGKDTFPVLNQYVQVLPHHVLLKRNGNQWYIKSLQTSERVYLNEVPLIGFRLRQIEIGDQIAFGAPKKGRRFVCCLTNIVSKASSSFVNSIELIDLSRYEEPTVVIKREHGIEDFEVTESKSATNNVSYLTSETGDNSLRSNISEYANKNFLTMKSEPMNQDRPNLKYELINNNSSVIIKSEKADNYIVKSEPVFNYDAAKVQTIMNEGLPRSTMNQDLPNLKYELINSNSSSIIKSEMADNYVVKSEPVFNYNAVKVQTIIEPTNFSSSVESNEKLVKSFREKKSISSQQCCEMSENTGNVNKHSKSKIDSNPVSNVKSLNSDMNKNPVPISILYKETNPGSPISCPFTRSLSNFSRKILSTISKENNDDKNAIEIQMQNYGYSEMDDVITISDDEAYLDFRSSQTIKQQHFDSDSNKDKGFENSKYNDTEPLRKNDKILLIDENSSISSISESIKDHEEKAEKLYGGNKHDTNEMKTSFTNFNLNQNIQNRTSNFSVSSHDDFIVPFSKEKLFKDINKENYEAKKSAISSDNKPKKQILLTEPKRMNHRPKQCKGREEWFEEKNINTSSFPSRESTITSSEDKSTLSKLKKKSYLKSQQSAKFFKKKDGSQQSNKTHLGAVVVKPLLKNGALSNFRIPKKNNKISSTKKAKLALLAEKEKQMKITEDNKKNLHDKKIPSIARKPNEKTSRSKFIISDMLAEKKKSQKKKTIPLSNKDVTSNRTSASNTLNVTNSTTKSNSINVSDQNDIVGATTPIITTLNVTNSTTKSNSINVNNQNYIVGTPIPTITIASRPIPIVSKYVTCNSSNLIKLSQDYPSSSSSKKEIISIRNSSDNNTNLSSLSVNSINNTDEQLNVMSSSVLNKREATMISENNFIQGNNVTNELNQEGSNIDQSKQLTNKNMQEECANISSVNNNVQIIEIKDKVLNLKISMVKKIVELNVKWLLEQKVMSKPPPILMDQVSYLPLFFNNLDHYISSFIPMLLLEIWEKLFQASVSILEDQRRVAKKFYFIIVSIQDKWDMTEYYCEAMVNNLSFAPEIGNVVILNIKNNYSINSILGYISSCEVHNNNNYIKPEWETLDQMWMKNAKLHTFSVLVKKRPFYPILYQIMKGNSVCSILKDIDLVNGFQDLHFSPFCQSILRPNISTFTAIHPVVFASTKFNSLQNMIIEGISAEIQNQISEPKIFLLKGPPGTGKTYVITGLLKKFIFNDDPKFKVLVVAPSSTAIDKIGSNIIELNKQSSFDFKAKNIFVRFNCKSETSQEMKPFTLEELYAKHINHKKEKLEKTNMHIQEMIKGNPVLQELNNLLEQQKQIREEINRLYSNEKYSLDYQSHLLKNSQIVLTTLDCCSSSLLKTAFGSNSETPFSCCIIDEAAQCTDIELLQILSLSFDKLIMVGDPFELPPTVHSKIAEEHYYGISMFQRFLHNFLFQNQDPSFTLYEQYRMHSEICSFPSRYIYDNLLTTAPEVDLKYEKFPIYPYTIFHITDCDVIIKCADCIVKICVQLLMLDPNISIGIIVPNQMIQDVFFRWISVLKINQKYRLIEVNTVENFQGKEKDAIILCYCDVDDSRSFISCGRRLNVALTRARHCLLICVFTTNLTQPGLKELLEDAYYRQLYFSVPKYKEMQLCFKLF